MARPKGSKDSRPRKRRSDAKPPKPIAPIRADDLRARSPEAPFGYTTRGIPRTEKRTLKIGEHGSRNLAKHLVEKGIIDRPEQLLRDKGGKPPLVLDEDQIRSLAKFGPTQEEMAAHFKCSVDTIRRYAHIIEEGKQQGRLMLRQKARILALEGNVPMLLHAAKHVLGERDEAPITNVAVAIGGKTGPGPYMPNILSPETADILARKFMEICPDPALVHMTVVLDPKNEVQSVQ